MALAVAQGFCVYNHVAASPIVSGIENFLFCFWFAPLAMAIFLDPDNESGELDTLVALDFVQAVLVCVAAYLYFFYIPRSESGEMAHSVWAPYFAGYGLVALSFILRGAISRTRDARVLFGRMGMSLVVSGCVDALYYYGPGRKLHTGAWFDLLWSALLVIPTLIATSWKQAEAPEHSLEVPRREKRIFSELFYLLYCSCRCALRASGWSWRVSWCCCRSSARARACSSPKTACCWLEKRCAAKLRATA
jgi:hypothetical protein